MKDYIFTFLRWIYKIKLDIIKANLTNADLSVLCTSTGNANYIKSISVATTPIGAGNGSIGKAGDFYFAADASVYFKTSDVSTSWVRFAGASV